MESDQTIQSMRHVESFYRELSPKLEAARKLDQEMNRIFAHRFNVLDYLRTNELGLSRIIADLFNPLGSHGQGAFFLEVFLRMLEEENNSIVDSRWFGFKPEEVIVNTELKIRDNRRIDIHVNIKREDSERFALAIENKPYAGDQESQVKDYLCQLENDVSNKGNFLLIYLSPRGEKPSESSLPIDNYISWARNFRMMAYHSEIESSVDEEEEGESEIEADVAEVDNSDENDQSEDYLISFALADWLSKCRKECEVDRLRWFLRDAEQFCKKRFGGSAMTVTNETSALHEFMISDANKVLISQKVYQSFPNLRKEVSEKFLRHLCEEIKHKLIEKKFVDDIESGYKFSDSRKYGTALWLYRKCWKTYQGGSDVRDMRTCIRLEAQEKGLNGFVIGIASPLKSSKMSTEEDKKSRYLLEEKLRLDLGENMKISDWWPQYRPLGYEHRSLNRLTAELFRENSTGSGPRPITDYFVNAFVDLAKKAIPIINEIDVNDNQ